MIEPAWVQDTQRALRAHAARGDARALAFLTLLNTLLDAPAEDSQTIAHEMAMCWQELAGLMRARAMHAARN